MADYEIGGGMLTQNFSIGSILARSFSVFGKNIVSFTVLGVLLHLPGFYIGYNAQESTGSVILIQIISVLSGQMLAATLTYGTVMELRGMHASIGKCIQVGVVRALPVLATAMLAGLAIGLGFVLLVIPGLIIMTVLYVAIPVAVIERPGVFASLSRSSELTRGYRMQIFGLSVVVWVCLVLIMMGVGAVIDDQSADTAYWLELGAGIVIAIFNSILAAVVYQDLRAIKDGVNIDELAAVFE